MRFYLTSWGVTMLLLFAGSSCNHADTTDQVKRENRQENTPVPAHQPLKLVVENIAADSGTVRIGVYGPHNDFPSEEDRLRTYRFIPKNGRVEEVIEDLEYGQLAFAIYHDVNNNGQIDKNGLGIPTEPYGFSNDAKPLLKAPPFEECKVTYDEQNNSVTIRLIGEKQN